MKIKNLITVSLTALLLTSCGWSEKNHQVSKPYTRTNDVERVAVKFDTGYREVKGHYDASGKWVPKQYARDTVRATEFATVSIEYVDVTPSRESVYKAAEATGWEKQLWIAVFLFLGVVGVAIYVINKNGGYFGKGEASWLTKFVALGIIVSLAIGLLNPINKSGNNTKTIRYDRYKELIKTDPNLIQFFDSIQKNGAFVN
jgi:hypothetical protein